MNCFAQLLISQNFLLQSSLVNFSEAHSFKVVAIGGSASGKTCLLIACSTNKFPAGYVTTVFDNCEVNAASGGRNYRLHLWDTAGQDDYDRLRPLSYPQTDCFMIVFSVDNPKSLESIITKWFPEINHHCPRVPFVIVGTKQDLREDADTRRRLASRGEFPVTYKQGKEVADLLGAAAYVECSAMVNTAEVRAVIDNILSAILNSTQRNRSNKACAIQ